MNQQSRDYWVKRQEQLQNSLLKPSEQYCEEMANIYAEAMRDIEKDIAVWYQRFADNNGVTDMAEARRMLNAGELKELKWDVNQYIKAGKENGISADWSKELENASAKVHISRLEALKLQTTEKIEELYGGRTDKVDSLLKDIYTEGYYKNAYELAKGTGIGQTFSRIDENKLDNLVGKPWTVDGVNFSDRIWQSKDKLINTVQNELTKGAITGATPKELTDKIAKEMNVLRAQAQRLVMTESAFFATKSQSDMYNNMGVDKYEILGTLDSTSCSECGSLDGKVFDTKDMVAGVTAPPFHPNCRCSTVPYFEDFAEDEQRFARDGEGNAIYVDGNMKYEEWKEKFVGDRTEDNKQSYNYATDDVKEIKALVNDGERGIIKAGAISGALNPNSKEANKHAKQYYESVRKMKTDVKQISENTGYDKETIQSIKDFIFMNTHDLGNGKYDYFYPSFEMAQSWQRLIDGKNIQPHDITLIKHEVMERDLMRAGLSQDEAHRLTSRTYNYQKESAEYYVNIEKNKKK